MRFTTTLMLAALSGCTAEVTLTDDIDLTWDFELTPIKDFSGSLHTPYVKGAPVTLYVHSSDEKKDFVGWTVESSDPNVFAIDQIQVNSSGDNHWLSASGRAVGEGTAGLIVVNDKGKDVGADQAEVLAPDAANLQAHGYLIMDRDSEAPVDDIRVVAGGTATYLVRYTRGGRELHGNSTLSVDSSAAVYANPRTTFLFENREWISVGSSTVGQDSIVLRSDGAAVATIPVITVPETDITDVALLAESERGHKDGEWMVLLAQATDGVSRKIFGVDFAWMIDGVMQTEDGDLYRYEFKKGKYVTVTAIRAGHSDTTEIQSDGGFVDSTNHIGCNAVGDTSSLAALGLVGLLVRRRRRTA